MENTKDYRNSVSALLQKAKAELAENMEMRDLGALVWDNSTAGFHFIPEIKCSCGDKGKAEVVRITGIYLFNGKLYLMEEEKSGVTVDAYYNPDVDVKPTVVTLSPDRANRDFGDPSEHPGFTTCGSLDEWLTIADCYFEALGEA